MGVPDSLRAEAADPDEERDCVDRLSDWLEEDEDHPGVLLEELPDLEATYRSRALRACRGIVEGSAILDVLSLEELTDTELHWLIDCLDPSEPAERSRLRELAEHSAGWVAGRALEALASQPVENERFLVERLRAENRQPVLVALLKKLLTVPGPTFERGLEPHLNVDDAPETVTFYAAALLKQRSPQRLESLAENSPYLRTIRDRVDVDSVARTRD